MLYAEKNLTYFSVLTKITFCKVKINWAGVEQDGFNEIKGIVACDVLFAHPGFNEEFKIHTNAIYLLLGAVILQNGKRLLNMVENQVVPKWGI